MKNYLLVLICTFGFLSCSVLNEGAGHHNYLTRIQSNSKSHLPMRLRSLHPGGSTASLPGGGPAFGFSDSYSRIFYGKENSDLFWFPRR